MAKEKSFTEKTSAGDTSIGFDYQHYYFLFRILNLGTGQSVGFEIKDDVHTELNDDFNILYQLKHTVQKNAAGEPIALTELDADLWKTLYNWSQVIIDKIDGREEIDAQLAFVAKTEFCLVSNKSLSRTNKFLKLLVDFQETEDFKPLDDQISYLSQKTDDDNIKKYITSVQGLAERVRRVFFEHIRLELGLDDVITRVKNSIREKIIAPEKIDAVFERLDSRISSDNFLSIKEGRALSISFEEFATRYGKIFEDARDKKLVPYRFQPALPDNIFAQKFIKRLIEIGALSGGDSERAVEYTLQKIRLSKNLEKWEQEGTIVGDEIDDFHNEVFSRWDNEFYGLFSKCSSTDEVVDTALELLRALKRERFRLSGYELDTQLSNGELYHLSDIGRIGWHRDWAENE
ncbi:ABC-three component system protein [Achromobacter xylosoxidans]|uniref:ABC-three component system protein n=1 Tax=Alcaligenes xylosoxydans xylosoxydans TaxID=85698 RepID=UPI0034D3E57A